MTALESRPRESGAPAVVQGPREQTAVTEFYSGKGAVTLGNLPAIKFDGSNPFTIEMWLYLDALVDKAVLVSRPEEFFLETRNGTIYAARTNQIMPLVTPPVLTEHAWYHIALTYDGITMAVYINGLRTSWVTVTDPGVPNRGRPMTIGGGLYAQTHGVRLWNSAVPPGAIYKNQWPSYPAGTANLVAQIDFAQWPPVDTSGAHVPVTVSPGVRKLLFTPAVTLAGQSFIDPYNDESVNPGGVSQDFTLMTWVDPHLLKGEQYLFSNGNIGEPGCSLSIGEHGRLSFRIGAAQPVMSATALTPDQWANVCCTWSASGAAQIYINGQMDASGSMPFSQGRPTGAPMIGASASAQSALPVSGFLGSIQSMSLWSKVLSSTEVQQYMSTDDPINAPTCTADYDFIPPRPQNSLSLNPVGLVGEVELHQLISEGTRTARATRSNGGLTAEPTSAEAPKPWRGPADGATSPDGPLSAIFHGYAPANVTAEDFSVEQRANWIAEFGTFMTKELGLRPEQQLEFKQRLEDNLASSAQALREGTATVPYQVTFESLPEGRTRVLLHEFDGTTVIYEGTLDPCTEWTIQFVIAIGVTVWSVFGFALNMGKVAQGLTNYLGQRINNIGLLPQLQAAFRNGPSPTSVYNSLKLLYEFGLLTGIAKFLWQAVNTSVSIWTIVSLGTRLLLLLGPFAPLEVALFVTELGLALINVYDTWQSKPQGCWSATPATVG